MASGFVFFCKAKVIRVLFTKTATLKGVPQVVTQAILSTPLLPPFTEFKTLWTPPIFRHVT